ncbi:MAG: amidinotransferase family protein [Myxococcaceae bacterium]|nr:amidinotransferase family protein [Myxococcaceae bacterium]
MASALSCEDLPAANGAHGASMDGCAYRVAWTINPHMRVGAARVERALRQHCRLLDAVRNAGGTIARLPFVHGAFDSVFAKDNALLRTTDRGCHALLASLVHEERRREQPSRREALERAGFVVHAPPVAPLEGGDVVVLPDGSAFLGHGFRSSADAAPTLARFLGAPVRPLRLRDPRLYHLDMALTVLHDGTALACEEAFEPSSFRTLLRATSGNLVRVAHGVALGFGINLIEVRGTVIVGAEHGAIRRELEARGKRVVVAPLDEFHHAGGSAACLVARVHDADAQAGAVAYSPTTAIRSTAA